MTSEEIDLVIKDLSKYRHIDPVIEKAINTINELRKNYKHKKRSKSQNAYMWELIGKLADILRLSKEEVYLDLLKNYGQGIYVKIRAEINPKNYFKYYTKEGEDNNCIFYKVYRGSSEYDSKEMTILIDGLIQECKQVGIETLTPEQIAQMKIN